LAEQLPVFVKLNSVVIGPGFRQDEGGGCRTVALEQIHEAASLPLRMRGSFFFDAC